MPKEGDLIFKAPSSEISESDVLSIQGNCSTDNLNESRESVFCSDQSEHNSAGVAVVTNVDNQSLSNLLIYTSEDSESDSSSSSGESDGYESPYEQLQKE